MSITVYTYNDKVLKNIANDKWLKKSETPVPTIYQVTTSATHGTVTANPTEGISGTEVTLSNTPDTHYHFGSYTLTGATLKNANQFDIANSDVSVVGNFIEDTKYSVTCTNDGHGTIAASPTSNYSGSTVTLSNTPNSGYTFDKYTLISGTGASISGNTLTIGTSNVTVRGDFKSLVPELQYRKVVCTPLNQSGQQYPMVLVNGSQHGNQYVYKAYKWSNGVKVEMPGNELDQLLGYGFPFESVIEVYLYLNDVTSVSILPMQPNSYLPQFAEVYNVYTDNSEVLVNSKTLNSQYEEFVVSFT